MSSKLTLALFIVNHAKVKKILVEYWLGFRVDRTFSTCPSFFASGSRITGAQELLPQFLWTLNQLCLVCQLRGLLLTSWKVQCCMLVVLEQFRIQALECPCDWHRSLCTMLPSTECSSWQCRYCWLSVSTGYLVWIFHRCSAVQKYSPGQCHFLSYCSKGTQVVHLSSSYHSPNL